jgi:ribulose kinase
MVTEPRLLSIDVGTSAAEAAVVHRSGREIAHGRSPVESKSVARGAEIEPPCPAERAPLAGLAGQEES